MRIAQLFTKQRFSNSSLQEEEIEEAKTSWLVARDPLFRGVFERWFKRK